MRILIIEDDRDISKFLKDGLEGESFAVDSAADGETGSYLARTNDYDLVVLDNMLPKKEGAVVCKEIREAGKTVPIIILSVKSEVPTKVELLNMGADDYLTKPFSFEELLARLRALLRRPKTFSGEVISVDNLSLDTKNHSVKRNNQEIYLTRKEFVMLEYFMRNQGQLLSRGMIMEHVWDRQGDLFSNTIETHILNLRKKIDFGKNKKLIHTIPGRGYKLTAYR